MQILNICLSDIPKNRLKYSEKSNKVYVSLFVGERREADQFGNDLAVSMAKTKEERELGSETIYVGSGKTLVEKPISSQEIAEMPAVPQDVVNDLPY